MSFQGAEFEGERAAGSTNEHRIHEYISLFFRGKWILLACTVVALAGMIAYTYKTQPIYEAVSTVIINQKNAGVANPLSDAATGVSGNKISNELGILKSRTMNEEVARLILKDPYIDSVKHEFLPIARVWVQSKASWRTATVGELAGRVRGSMDFQPERDSDLLRIIAKSGDPQEAAVLANKYAEAYQEQNMNASRNRSKSLREFLESRLTEQRGALANTEGSLKNYMESKGIVSIDGESNDIVQQLSQLEANRNAIDLDIETLTKALKSYQEQLPRQESRVTSSIGQASDAYIRRLQDELARLEAQRDVVAIQNNPQTIGQELYSEKLKEYDDQIKALRLKLEARSKEYVQSLIPGDAAGAQSDPLGYLKQTRLKILETRIQLQSLQTKKEALEGYIQQYERKFEQIPGRSLELAKLQRARLSTEKLYLLVEERFNEAAITEKSEFGYVDIVDAAVPLGTPINRNLRMNLFLGLLLGLGFGAGVVVLRDVMDVRVRTPEQLRRRGYLTLSEVGHMAQELRAFEKANGIPGNVKRFDRHLWLIFSPMSFLAESYRRLRTSIVHWQMTNKSLKSVLVTSPSPGEGKTTTVCNLAIAFAETQQRVLLIDADLRRPSVHTAFAVSSRVGLTDFLAGKATLDQVIHRNVVEHLDIICCGPPIMNAGKVFSSKSLASLLADAKKEYAWVLVDAPPILVVNDAADLASMTDATLITVSTGNSRVAALDKAAEFLHAAGGNVIGVVLNMFDPRREYGRFYGGHHYGHYGVRDNYYSSSNTKDSRRKSKSV